MKDSQEEKLDRFQGTDRRVVSQTPEAIRSGRGGRSEKREGFVPADTIQPEAVQCQYTQRQ